MLLRVMGLARTLVVSMGLATALMFAASAEARPAELLVPFVTADRNIECLMVDPDTTIGNVSCVMHSKGYTTKGDSDNPGLTAHPHLFWFVDYARHGDKGSTDREIDSFAPHRRVLREGQSVTVGYFSCSSRPTGLTCLSRHSGHGFLLSRVKQQTF